MSGVPGSPLPEVLKRIPKDRANATVFISSDVEDCLTRAINLDRSGVVVRP
jgi:hypothetical protein